jgi:hypothetical protein
MKRREFIAGLGGAVVLAKLQRTRSRAIAHIACRSTP